MRKIALKNAVDYTSKRVSSDKISINIFISTDNILPNKAGITAANYAPFGTMPAYNNGDILVANIRPYLKKIWYATHKGGCSADVLVFKVKEGFDSKFIYYALLRDDFFAHMMKGAKGTKMPRGDKKQILDFLVPDFDFETQRKIAAVLSSLDSKIELNNRINAELEAMAKTLYDYWFVQFEFPNANGRPYKTSGGKMVWNEELKREIPEGWGVGVLSDIANITMGQSPAGESYNDTGEGLIFYQGCTDFGWRYPTVRLFTTAPTRFAKAGDILLSVRAPVGTLNIADSACCIGRGLAALNSKSKHNTYLFATMQNLKPIFDRRNVDGTTFGSITKDDLYSLKVVLPPTHILRLFQTIIENNDKVLLNKHRENQQLTELRDWLLPMLMNGQVTVEEAEERFAMAAEPEVVYGKQGGKRQQEY